jgi:hypothetical protein
MSAEIIVALVISILAGLGHFVKETHIKKCKCFCVDSDCIDCNLDKKMLDLEEQIEKRKNKLQSLKHKKDESNPPTPAMSPSQSITELISDVVIDTIIEKSTEV